jgi:hypothetical protein
MSYKFWSYSNIPQLSEFSSPSLPTQLCVLLFRSIHEIQFVLPKYTWIWNCPMEHAWLTRGYSLRKSTLPLSAANNFTYIHCLSCIQIPIFFLPLMQRFIWLDLVQALCSLSELLWVHVQLPWYVHNSLLIRTHPPPLTFTPFHSIFFSDHWVFERDMWYMFKLELSISQSPIFCILVRNWSLC